MQNSSSYTDQDEKENKKTLRKLKANALSTTRGTKLAGSERKMDAKWTLITK